MSAVTLYTMTSFYSLVFFFFISVIVIFLSPKRWNTLLTIFLGLVTAFIDVQSSEVSFSILLLLAFGFFLGFVLPAKPLKTGALFVVWLPLATFIHLMILGRDSTFLGQCLGSFIAFIPAIGGTYLGGIIRRNSGESLLAGNSL